MRSTPLHPRFGVEIHDVDIRDVTAAYRYPEIREAFETHSLLLFRSQHLDDHAHLAFGALFGPIEDRSYGLNGPTLRMDNVTNRLPDGRISAADDLHTLNLIANQLWHTDSTFLPVPALANILAARVLSSTGGETQLVSTRAAWTDMPETFRKRVRGRVLHHRLGHSRSRISPELAHVPTITKWADQTWKAIWRNPVNGEEALYIASHAYGVGGLSEPEGLALIDELVGFATRPEMIYTHSWRPGDVLVWDERATLHRGRPWLYEEERTLASICVSVTDADGLETMRA